MPGTFTNKKINVSFSIGAGQTGEKLGGSSVTALTGHRISCKIVKAGSDNHATATVQIYGMRLEVMVAMARAGPQPQTMQNNFVTIEAGDDTNGMNVVFTGNITYAWPDLTNAPQAMFRLEAMESALDEAKPAEPTSFKGPVPFEQCANAICQKIGRTFESNGVDKILNNPYFYGSGFMQFRQLAAMARVGWTSEDNQTIAAWPIDGSRQGGDYEISKANGMVTDPIGTQTGIIVKTLYKRPLKFGTNINVQSILGDAANGKWAIQRLEYSLESQMPHGEWFVTIEAQRGQN
jgi:hypothetical protein